MLQLTLPPMMQDLMQRGVQSAASALGGRARCSGIAEGWDERSRLRAQRAPRDWIRRCCGDARLPPTGSTGASGEEACVRAAPTFYNII